MCLTTQRAARNGCRGSSSKDRREAEALTWAGGERKAGVSLSWESRHLHRFNYKTEIRALVFQIFWKVGEWMGPLKKCLDLPCPRSMPCPLSCVFSFCFLVQMWGVFCTRSSCCLNRCTSFLPNVSAVICSSCHDFVTVSSCVGRPRSLRVQRSVSLRKNTNGLLYWRSFTYCS